MVMYLDINQDLILGAIVGNKTNGWRWSMWWRERRNWRQGCESPVELLDVVQLGYELTI
jgi:hypothetical protein